MIFVVSWTYKDVRRYLRVIDSSHDAYHIKNTLEAIEGVSDVTVVSA